MKILHLLYESKGDYFGIGGVGIRAYEIYKYLKDRHDITLLCKKYPGASDGEIDGLRHIFVGAESRSLTKTLLSYAYHASRFVRKYGKDYDIIVEDFSPAIPTFFNFFSARPIVLQVQGYTGIYYFRKYNPAQASLLSLLETLRPLCYKNFIFISKETIRKVFKKSLASKEDSFTWKNRYIRIIPNGINPKLLDVVPEEDNYILYIGRIDIYGKGLDILLRAYREFLGSFPHVRLVIAGDGRDKKKFESMLMGLPGEVQRNIEMPGWVTGDKKIDLIRKALFCIFPSRHEVQSIAAFEAIACGKAVVVSNIPEFNYVFEKEAGISFKIGDAQSLAQSMKDLIISNKRIQIGLRGRDFMKGFAWDRLALQYENFLNKVLKKNT